MGLFSYMREGVRTLVNLRTNPANQTRHPFSSTRHPFSSTRQHKRHAARQYEVVTRSGFVIMQTRPASRIKLWAFAAEHHPSFNGQVYSKGGLDIKLGDVEIGYGSNGQPVEVSRVSGAERA